MADIEDFASGAVRQMIEGLYGPKFCDKCQKIQPVQTYKLQGSDFDKMEGMVYTQGFTGAHVCTVCHSVIQTGVEK